MSTCPMGLTSALAVPRTVPEASSNSWHYKCRRAQVQQIGFAIGRLGQYERTLDIIEDHRAGHRPGVRDVSTTTQRRSRLEPRLGPESAGHPAGRMGDETPSPRCSSRLTTGVSRPSLGGNPAGHAAY